MEPGELLEHLKDTARAMGIVDLSAASVESWNTDPLVSSRVGEGNRPSDIMPGSRSVVVIGVPLQPEILDTAPSIYYNHLYGVVNSLLDQATERLALELNILGHRAVYIPRDSYHGRAGLRERQDAFFSHRHAAYLAGMGTFGWNNMLLTEKNGPRIRFSSVITDAELQCSGPLEKNICIRCGRCARQCPAGAIGKVDYPGSIVDKPACVENSDVLARMGTAPCGRCIAVCPVGRDGSAGPNDAALETIRSYKKPMD